MASKSFAENLTRIRTAKGIGMNELARQTGGEVSASLISKYERGDTEPGIQNVVKLATALDVPTDCLAPGGKGDCEEEQ